MNRKVRWILSVIVTTFAGLTIFGNGCSEQGFFTNVGTDSSSAGVGLGEGSAEDVIMPGVKTVSLVYSTQALDQLTACTGVVSPSDETLRMFDQKKGAISLYGTAKTVNASMMMAVTSVAGEVCNDLLGQELSQGSRIFKGMDLNAATLPADGILTSVLGRLALSCWQRPETSGERQMIMDMIYTNVKQGPNQARVAALMMCTSVLSSLDSLLN